MAKDRVRYMGEIVAVVVADSREHATDATEAVDVDYDELPVVTDIEEALADGAHVIHEQFGSNELYTWDLHNGDVDKVFAEAPVVVSERYFHPRLIANAIEPRAIVVQPVPAQGEFTVWSATQIPHFLRVFLTLILGIPETKIRVIAPRSAAASAPSWRSTPRSSSPSPWPASSASRSSGTSTAPRATCPPSRAAA